MESSATCSSATCGVSELGTHQHPSPRLSRITCFFYGAGAALTLDEFALWLNLEDDYWTAKGRESIDAVLVFGTLLSIGALGGGVLHKYAHRLQEQRHSKQSAKTLAFLKDRQTRLRHLLAYG